MMLTKVVLKFCYNVLIQLTKDLPAAAIFP